MKTHRPLKFAGVAIVALVAAFAASQLIRPDGTNLKTDPTRTIQATLAASSSLGPVLDRACGECHSNTMSSLWYTRVTPFSFLIARADPPLELRRRQRPREVEALRLVAALPSQQL